MSLKIIHVFSFIEAFPVGLTRKNYQLEIKGIRHIAINFQKHSISFCAGFFPIK